MKEIKSYILLLAIFLSGTILVNTDNLYYSVLPADAPAAVYSNAENPDTYLLLNADKSLLYFYRQEKLVNCYGLKQDYSCPTVPAGEWTIISVSEQTVIFKTSWGTFGIRPANPALRFPFYADHKQSEDFTGFFIDKSSYSELTAQISAGDHITIKQTHIRFRELQPGDMGYDVYILQNYLKDINLFHETSDGIYSEAMRNAVLLFQRSYALYPTGCVNISTFKRLLSVIEKMESQQTEFRAGVQEVLRCCTKSQVVYLY